MCVSLSRARLIVAAAILLAVAALVLGLVLPPERTSGSRNALSAGDPQLLISAYEEEESTLWLVDPDDPNLRQPLFPVPHAPGWAIEGAVSPGGDRVALLVVPADGGDPDFDAQLLISEGGAPRPLAEGLDLRGGVVWTADGAELLTRRRLDPERPAFALVAIDAAIGGERTLHEQHDGAALYPIGRPIGGPVYAVVVGAGGSDLLRLGAETASERLSRTVTRDWTLSPDGRELAFTEQRGLALRVMVARLDDAESIRVAQATPVGGDAGSAAPAWSPNGELSVGRFRDLAAARPAVASGEQPPASWFSLPLGWSADGAHLAMRSFDGTGPGAPGRETLTVRGPSGPPLPIGDTSLRFLGWWHDAD